MLHSALEALIFHLDNIGSDLRLEAIHIAGRWSARPLAVSTPAAAVTTAEEAARFDADWTTGVRTDGRKSVYLIAMANEPDRLLRVVGHPTCSIRNHNIEARRPIFRDLGE